MTEPIKLTTLTSKGGCGCKIGPTDLSRVLKDLPQNTEDPNLLVGLETGDDAGVYKLTDDLAIVQTLDFFTPIVDDPYDFGQVAAANAISDVYAMGATPATALNIVAFPITELDGKILTSILKGAGDKLAEAGVSLAGGHSIDDPEPKFGLSVTGSIHPENIRTNSGAQPGDKLILTKPIGVGVMTTALKRGLLTDEEINTVTNVMTTLNKTAAEVMSDYTVHASTDVTGFGLLGHALEMAEASGVGMTVQENNVPVLTRAKELAASGAIPGGSKNNFDYIKDRITYPVDMSQIDRWILSDAVTSGGLLTAVPADQADALLQTLQNKDVDAAIIGEVTTDSGHIIVN